jgi:hypothetical protein
LSRSSSLSSHAGASSFSCSSDPLNGTNACALESAGPES